MGCHPSVFRSRDQTPKTQGSHELLLTIPGAVVHLIDGEQSVHLATGSFSLIRLIEAGNGIGVLAKVGEQLQWPLAKDEPTGKLDRRHYFFCLKFPREVEEGVVASEEEENHEVPQESTRLNYGVTFTEDGTDALFEELDKHLQQYSYFSAPSVVHGQEELAQQSAAAEQRADKGEGGEKRKSGLDLLCERIFGKGTKKSASTDVATGEKESSAEASSPTKPPKAASSDAASSEKKRVEESSAAYWTILAPNVEDYNSRVAKGIAAGSGQLIRGIFWCSDATVEQLEKGCLYMKGRIKPNDKPIHFSPRTLRNLRRVKKMSRLTERLAMGVLSGIVTTTGIITGTIIKSKAGKKFFKMLPGEVALVSMDAFGKVFDAVEEAGKKVLISTNTATTELVSHRYGEEAGEAAHQGLSTAGHVLGTAWVFTKIRKALNPKKGAKTGKSGLMKTAGKAVLHGVKK